VRSPRYFFTTEVWTWQGLVTFYTVFMIELASRRVQILGSTPHPDEAISTGSTEGYAANQDTESYATSLRSRVGQYAIDGCVIETRFAVSCQAGDVFASM
jgi:hypothetical protein